MKPILVMGAAVALASAGCGGGGDTGNTGGFKENTGGAGGHHVIAGTGGDGSGANNPGTGAGGAGSTGGNNPSSSSAGTGGLASCPSIFPADNWWNKDISGDPVDGNSDNYIDYIYNHPQPGNGSKDEKNKLHADFDSGGDGIPYNVVDSSVAKVNVTFHYDDQSDHEGYPIPPNPKQENDNDGHVLLYDTSECKLYELGNVEHDGGQWAAGAGAIWDLKTDELRHDCWTSADAAGLPIFPGLVRYDEVTAGAINHALRFTIYDSQQAWIKPARHEASSDTNKNAPPMGLRLRLKSNAHVNGIVGGAGAQPKVVLVALQKYGMLVADNGSNLYVSGEPNPGWKDDDFHAAFDQLKAQDFEVVKSADPIEYHSDPSCR